MKLHYRNYRYAHKKYKKALSRYRKKKQNKWRNNVTMGVAFPKKLCITHKFLTNGTITSSTGSVLNTVFNANSLYEPVSGVSTHQPLYFDQISGIYDHYTVIASEIILKVVPTQSTQVPIRCSLYIGDDATSLSAPGNMNTLGEYPSGSLPLLIPQGVAKTYTLRKKWSAKKFFGGAVLANNKLTGNYNSSPSELSTYMFSVVSASTVDPVPSGGVNVALYYEALIKYTAVWTELTDGLGS